MRSSGKLVAISLILIAVLVLALYLSSFLPFSLSLALAIDVGIAIMLVVDLLSHRIIAESFPIFLILALLAFLVLYLMGVDAYLSFLVASALVFISLLWLFSSRPTF